MRKKRMSDLLWPLFPLREMDVCIGETLYTEGSVQGMPPHACSDSFLPRSLFSGFPARPAGNPDMPRIPSATHESDAAEFPDR